MRSRAASAAVAVAVSATLVAACGDQNRAETVAKAPRLASAAAVASDPYSIECGHIRDQLRWAEVTRRATVAIADREPVPGLNRLHMTQSVFYAMTELCKARPPSYQPARAAVRGVSSGRYVVGRKTS
jgi:hypothetical protein